MILQRAENLVTLIERSQDMGKQRQLIQGFRTQRDTVRGALGELERAVTTYQVLQARGIDMNAVAGSALEVLGKLKDLRSQYEKDKQSILGPGRIEAVTVDLQRFVMAVKQQMLVAWQQYAGSRTPKVNQEVLSVLRRVPGLRKRIDVIHDGLRVLDGLSQQLPAANGDVAKFDERASALHDMWTTLDEEHLPREVLQFLQEASAGGAHLNRLTETVSKWLADHELTTAFQIRPSPSHYGNA